MVGSWFCNQPSIRDYGTFWVSERYSGSRRSGIHSNVSSLRHLLDRRSLGLSLTLGWLVMLWNHPASLPPPELMNDCQVARTRASGPGGQRRNKVETAVRITHSPTGLMASASERRNQHENQEMALFRLRLKLALELRCPTENAPQPTDLWRSRCRKGRISVNSSHMDFPALIAEALDVLMVRDWEPQSAAEWFSCSASQLIKLLKQEIKAMAWVNKQRISQGKHPLR